MQSQSGSSCATLSLATSVIVTLALRATANRFHSSRALATLNPTLRTSKLSSTTPSAVTRPATSGYLTLPVVYKPRPATTLSRITPMHLRTHTRLSTLLGSTKTKLNATSTSVT